jgi:site-specific recombinase XerD
MLRVLWRTGVRVNELLNIRPSDVEIRNSVVNVTKAKGGKQRRVHLDAGTIKMLSEYVSTQQLLMMNLFLPSNNDRCETAGTLDSSSRCSGIRV